MKTNQTMMLALLGAAACSFCFGLGQKEAGAGTIGGTGLTNCVTSCCEYIHCFWNDLTNYSAQVTGSVWPSPFKNTSTALASIVVQADTPGGCKVTPIGNYDKWEYDQSTATCQNTNGTYPYPQIVTPLGTPRLVTVGVTRNQCSN